MEIGSGVCGREAGNLIGHCGKGREWQQAQRLVLTEIQPTTTGEEWELETIKKKKRATGNSNCLPAMQYSAVQCSPTYPGAAQRTMSK